MYVCVCVCMYMCIYIYTQWGKKLFSQPPKYNVNYFDIFVKNFSVIFIMIML